MLRKHNLFLLFILLGVCGASVAVPQTQAVVRILNGKSFVLASGETVRLAAIEAPNVEEPAEGMHKARSGEPLAEEAKTALEELLRGHAVHIDYNPGMHDRHGRLLGQVYRDDGLWIQGALLKDGWAMTCSFSDDATEMIGKMLAAEKEAQGAKRGIWAHPFYRVIAPQEAQEFIGRFKLVEGRLLSVHDYHGHIYLNFFERWKGNFAVFISRKYAPSFTAMNLPSLVGKIIRVRGWLDYHNAPQISLTHPTQIEVK